MSSKVNVLIAGRVGKEGSMNARGELAFKIMQGKRLTIKEFELAIKEGVLTGGVLKTDQELAEAYLHWLGQCYEDDTRHAYLCSKSPTRTIKKGIREDGTKYETLCIWGVHMDEVKPDFLTKENIKFLRHHFGKVKVGKLTGR